MSHVFVVIDDHMSVLAGLVAILGNQFPDARILSAMTSEAAKLEVEQAQPTLVICDLSIPKNKESPARLEVGLKLLQHLMGAYPTLNIVAHSAHSKSLVRIKPFIDSHQGGFVITDKSANAADFLTKVDWALNGIVYTPPEFRMSLEIKPEWQSVLELAFKEGLQDKAIAEQMHVSERTVRHYWSQIYTVFSIDPVDGQNIRLQVEIAARKAGYLD